MARIYDCSENSELLAGMRLARAAIGRGELVVIPTDTVYGIAADAFTPRAVQRLLDAKGRTRQAPPPVLIPNLSTLDALAGEVPDAVRELVAVFWPGALTIILPSQPSLLWDLGDTNGTVALRMPANPVALELLAETGPLAVSSANLTGRPAADTADQAQQMLGDSVTVYLDSGRAGPVSSDSVRSDSVHSDSVRADSVIGEHQASTIIDATGLSAAGGKIRVLRPGVITDEQLRAVIGDLLETVDAEPSPEVEPLPEVEPIPKVELLPKIEPLPDAVPVENAAPGDGAAPGARVSG